MSARFTRQQIENAPLPHLSDAKKHLIFKNVFNQVELDASSGQSKRVLSRIGKKSYEEIIEKCSNDHKSEDEITLEDVYFHIKEFSTYVRNVLVRYFHQICDSHSSDNLKQYVIGIPIDL
jgi:uncharacterized membrane protein